MGRREGGRGRTEKEPPRTRMCGKSLILCPRASTCETGAQTFIPLLPQPGPGSPFSCLESLWLSPNTQRGAQPPGKPQSKRIPPSPRRDLAKLGREGSHQPSSACNESFLIKDFKNKITPLLDFACFTSGSCQQNPFCVSPAEAAGPSCSPVPGLAPLRHSPAVIKMEDNHQVC